MFEANPRLLFIGQWALPTGMARVGQAVVRSLSAHFSVHVVAIDGYADQHISKESIAITRNLNDWDVFGEEALQRALTEFVPDIVLIYHDPWHVPRYLNFLKPTTSAPIWAYCPIDGNFLRPDVLQELRGLSGLVTPAEFGKRALIDCARDIGSETDQPFCDIRVVPHGVDLNRFFPLTANSDGTGKKKAYRARHLLYPDRPDLWEGFWILNANRNTERKQLLTTLAGFAAFSENKPANVRIHLPWTGDRAGGDDLRRAAQALGIEARLVPNVDAHKAGAGVTTEQLNLIYNASQVGVNTARGEGFGLVSLEHAATRAAQIVPAHSACEELWRDNALLLPQSSAVNRSGMVTGYDVSAADVAMALNRLWANVDVLADYASRAFDHARDQIFDWSHIGAQWAEHLGIERRTKSWIRR